jgi:hypothetical protein
VLMMAHAIIQALSSPRQKDLKFSMGLGPVSKNKREKSH